MNTSASNSTLRVIIGMLVCMFSFLALVLTADDIGWTFDEVFYFLSSELIIEWFTALLNALPQDSADHVLSQNVIDTYWLWDIEHNCHPPLYKIFSAATLFVFRDLLGNFCAYRLAPMLLASILITGLYMFLSRRYGILSGICAGACLLLLPRFFGHAHFGVTETPLMTFWFLSYIAFWNGRQSLSWSFLCAVFMGCALAIKFTAILVPIPLIVWALLFRDKPAIRTLGLGLVIAPLVAWMFNPGWWYDPVPKIIGFIQASLSRETTVPIATYFWGKTYSFSPPWHYAPVMAALTTPVTTLFLFIAGLYTLFSRRHDRVRATLFFLPIPFMLLITMLPGTPIHDGVRQFIYIFPFMAYFCGLGFHQCCTAVNRYLSSRGRGFFNTCLCLLCILYPLTQVLKIHPYELSYYNKIIGGIQGAYRRGMEVTYWFDAINKPAINALNSLPPDAVISIWPMPRNYFEFLQEKGSLRKDLRFVATDIAVTGGKKGVHFSFNGIQPHYLLLLSRFGSFNRFYWSVYRHSIPVYSQGINGIPLVMLYRWKDIKIY